MAELEDSCYGRCGEATEDQCSCDLPSCEYFDDCCEDVDDYCQEGKNYMHTKS